MKANLIRARSVLWFSTVLLLACGGYRAQAADMKLQAHLLWGTDDSKPPEGKAYKAVEGDIQKKLKDLPLKWTHWFEVNRLAFAVPSGVTKEASVSEKCQLRVKQLSDTEIEVTLIGKGKVVVKRRQSLPKGEMLVLGGNAPNSTAWLVVLRRIE